MHRLRRQIRVKFQKTKHELRVEPRYREPHGLMSVAPPHASSGETLRSIPSFAKATEGYPSRIHPRTNVRGLLRRRVKRPTLFIQR
jgi:hypothetical protein